MNLYFLTEATSALTDAVTSLVSGTETTTLAEDPTFFQKYGMIIFLVLIFAVMYFLMIRPQKKQQKKDAEMRNNISVGDEVITIGGIMGRIVTVKEDSVIIETGSDKSKMRILRSAISRVMTTDEAQR